MVSTISQCNAAIPSRHDVIFKDDYFDYYKFTAELMAKNLKIS